MQTRNISIKVDPLSYSSVFGNKALPFAEVDFYLVDKEDHESFVAMDNTQPYRAVLMPDSLQSMQDKRVF